MILQRRNPLVRCAQIDMTNPANFEERAAFVAHVVLWLNKYNVLFCNADIQLAKGFLTAYGNRISLSAGSSAVYSPNV